MRVWVLGIGLRWGGAGVYCYSSVISGERMLIRIEASSGVPITRQIVDQVRARCAGGELKAGDRLPSVRELARQLAVNQNTILRAYERLTAEGVLELRHGEGTFVAAFAAGQQLRREKSQLAEEAQRLVRRAAVLGVSAEQVREIVNGAIEQIENRKVKIEKR
jgi:GntR family transcriptional regulator